MAVKPGYKRTEVGVIPEDWDACTLDAISSKITDGDHLTPKRVPHGYYLLSARNVRDGRIDLSDVDFVGVDEYKRMRQRCAPQVGDLLLSCSGHGLGRVASVPEGLECVLVRSAALVKLNLNRSDSLFIQYWLQSTHAQDQISISKSLAAQPNLFLSSIEKLRCPLPATVGEQCAIGETLGDADALIESQEQLIGKKRQIKQGALQELLTGKRRLSGFSGDWEVKRLGDIAHIKTGSRNNENKVEDGKYPFFVRSEVIERINSYSHDCEAILVPGEGRIGSIFHYVHGRFDVHQRVYAITQFKPDISGRFIHFYLSQNFGPWAMQNTVKATVDSLRLPTFVTFEVTLPPTFAEQTAIAEVLSDLDAEIAALEERRDKVRALKQGMMQELLTGRIRLV